MGLCRENISAGAQGVPRQSLAKHYPQLQFGENARDPVRNALHAPSNLTAKTGSGPKVTMRDITSRTIGFLTLGLPGPATRGWGGGGSLTLKSCPWDRQAAARQRGRAWRQGPLVLYSQRSFFRRASFASGGPPRGHFRPEEEGEVSSSSRAARRRSATSKGRRHLRKKAAPRERLQRQAAGGAQPGFWAPLRP